jgi:hypothetical protein
MMLCLLYLAPALALAAMLLLRRYPGERLLVALRRRSAMPRTRTRARLRSPSHPVLRVPRGGLLMAFALAVRPPPAPLVS